MRFISRFGNLAISRIRQRARRAKPAGLPHTGPGVVLAYTGIANDQVARFRTQMEWLAEQTIVQPLTELVALDTAMSERPRVAITFDGAFDSVHRNAIPMLEAFGLPATVFPVSDFLGRSPGWDRPRYAPDAHEIVMTVGQLASLRRELFEVGSLTASHPHLDRLPPERIRAELLNSKNDLEAALARPICALSVPFGAWNPLIVSTARQAGYDVVVTRDAHLLASGSQPLVVGRCSTSPDDWPGEFELKTRGWYGWRMRRKVDDRACGLKDQAKVSEAKCVAESTLA